MIYSEQFNQSPTWTIFGTASVIADSVVAPDLTSTADSITLPVGSGIYQNITASPNTTYTFSVYIRAASAVTVRHVINSNLSDPTTTTLNVTTSWQRFFISKTTSVGTTYISAQLDIGSGATIYVWGAQLEVGSQPSAYQRIGSTSNSADSLILPVDTLNILTSRSADSFSTPTDTQYLNINLAPISAQINNIDSGNVYLNAYNITQYFSDTSYLQATRSF